MHPISLANIQKDSVLIMLINNWSHFISFLLAVDVLACFWLPPVGFVNVVSANRNKSHVYVLADWNSCGLVALPFLVAVQTRGATS